MMMGCVYNMGLYAGSSDGVTEDERGGGGGGYGGAEVP